MQIFFIRHGETYRSLNKKGPETLTKVGEKQVKLLAKRFVNKKFDIIISSNLERAVKTAEAIHIKNPHLKLKLMPDLGEMDVKEHMPKTRNVSKLFHKEDLLRANRGWKKLLSLKYKRMLVVCHGNIIRLFLSKAMGYSGNHFPCILLEPTSISVVEIKKGRINVLSINDSSHLTKNFS